MARLIRLLLATCILTRLPLESEAGDVFTGFQIDNKSQYFIDLQASKNNFDTLGMQPCKGEQMPSEEPAGWSKRPSSKAAGSEEANRTFCRTLSL